MLRWCDCYAPIIGRVLMGGYFLWTGLLNAAAFGSSPTYFESLSVPYPEAWAVAAIAIEIIFGLMLVVGYRTRLAALTLAVWTIASPALFISNFADPNASALLLRDIAIAGGLLYASAFGSGGWNIGSRK